MGNNNNQSQAQLQLCQKILHEALRFGQLARDIHGLGEVSTIGCGSP